MDTIFTGLDIWNRVPAAFEYENFFSGQVKLYLRRGWLICKLLWDKFVPCHYTKQHI